MDGTTCTRSLNDGLETMVTYTREELEDVEDLDDIVMTLKIMEATDINNHGKAEQIAYIMRWRSKL
jgi:hypothetical protein